MTRIEIKSFDSPDETRPFEGRGRVEIVNLGGREIGKGIFEPGWRWSENVKPIAETDSCKFSHLGYVLSGRMRVHMDDGTEGEIGPGDVFAIPAGHDAEVVGDEPCVMVDIARRTLTTRSGPEMVEFTLAADTSAPAEAVLAAARDFSRRRIEIWPNVSAKRYAVHASGDIFTETTETALEGLFWERTRYQWAQPGRAHQTVLDSNVLAPGSTWEITAVPNGDGCHVECIFRREFVRSPKGLFGWLINRFASSVVYGWDLRRALARIEKQRESGSLDLATEGESGHPVRPL